MSGSHSTLINELIEFKTYAEAMHRLQVEFGFPRDLAYAMCVADAYGMGIKRFSNLNSDAINKNIAEAYRPEGVP